MKAPEHEVHDESTFAAGSPAVSRSDAALVAAFLVSPCAWAFNLGLAYALVYPAARQGTKAWLWASAVSSGALTIAAALVAYAVMRKTRDAPMPDDARTHTRALGVAACALSAFFLLAIIAQSIPLLGLGLHDR